MKKITINFYSDPGHGWGKIKLAALQYLGLVPEISTYSYVRKGDVYLEEDSDLRKLLDTLTTKGIAYSVVAHHTNKSSKIRSYKSFDSKTLAATA